MQSGSRQTRLEFARFVFDPASRELYCDGSRVQLQEQPAQVLTALLDRPGDIVTREDLRERLWPSDTFVDFDHGLNAAVKKIRRALGDSAETPSFVETLSPARLPIHRAGGDCCLRCRLLPPSRLRSPTLHSPSRRQNHPRAGGGRFGSPRSGPWRCSAVLPGGRGSALGSAPVQEVLARVPRRSWR